MSNTKSAESTLSEPIFNRQALVRLILPLLAEQFLSVSMGMADTLMVSGVGEAAVSSVSLVDSLNILIIQILSALATGGAVISSQYLGRRDGEKAAKSAAQLYTVLAVSTIAVMLVILVLSRPILRIVFGRIDDDVMRFSQTYFLISAISYPFIGFYNAGAALFRAQGNSRISMLASLVMNIINICFNALFIYGLGMGVLGAALATLLGRVFAAAWVFWQQQQIENPLCIRHIADMKPDGDLIRRILGIGIPSGLENGMFQIGKLCVSSLTSTLGTSAIAANAVANTISGIANIPGSTMGLAMIPVVSRCLGAGDKKQAKHYAKMFILMAMLGLFCTNACLFFTIPYIARLFSLSDTALNMCVTVMHWFSLFSVVCWATSFTLPNALRSGGDARYTMTVSIFSMWLFRVILSYIFVLKLNMGLTAPRSPYRHLELCGIALAHILNNIKKRRRAGRYLLRFCAVFYFYVIMNDLQDVPLHGGQEQLFRLGTVGGLAQHPHQFDCGGFGGHIVRFQYTGQGFGRAANFVHGKVAALMRYLGGEHSQVPRAAPVPHGGKHGTIIPAGQAAHAKAFQHQGAVTAL